MASLVLLASPRAPAAPTPGEQVAFAWVRGEEAERCPSAAGVAREVSARLGRDPFSSDARRSIEGSVAREQGRWVVRLRVFEAGKLVGSRDLTSQELDCAAITAASVLSIALVIDPDVALRPPLPAPAPSAPPDARPPSVEPPRGRRPVPPPAPPPVLWPKITASSRAITGFGLLPGVAPGLSLAAGLEDSRWEGAAGMLWLPESRSGDRSFAFGLTAGWAGACLNVVRRARVSVATCGSVFGGALHAVVLSLASYEPLQPGDRAWAAISLTQRLRIWLWPNVAAELGVELIAPLTRYSFAVEGQPEAIFTASQVAAAPFVGVGVSIP